MTINRGIGPEQTIWQFRAALNVGALVCRGPGYVGLVADYNRILKGDRATLRTADRAVKRLYRSRYGASWVAAHDVYMTRLYNFWAQPEGKLGFCAAAVELAADAAHLPGVRFAAFAKAHLDELEKPFLQVFDRIAATQARIKDWDAFYEQGRSGPPPAAAGAPSGSR